MSRRGTWDERWVAEALASGDLDRTDDGMTAVWHAVYFSKADWVPRLLDAGARADAHDEDAIERGAGTSAVVGMWRGVPDAVATPTGTTTLLHVACASRKPAEMVELLLARHFEVDARDRCGTTPLHIAAWHHDEDAVSLLLAAGADPNLHDRAGYTALDHGGGGNVDVLERLLAAGASPDGGPRLPPPVNSYHSVLQGVAHAGNHRAVALLLAHGAKPARHALALPAAAIGGHTRCVQILVDAGAPLRDLPHSHYGQTAMRAAAASGSIDTCAVLVDAFADELDDAVATAIQFAHYDIAKEDRRLARLDLVGWLVDRGADPTACLPGAADASDDRIACLLVERGARVDATDDHGNPVLIIAARRGHRRLAELLLTRGADPQTVGVDGISAYAVARHAYKTDKIDDARFIMSAITARGGGPPTPPVAPAPKVAGPGTRVTHAKFGAGAIVSIAGDKWTVKFDSGESRVLVAKVLTLA